ncbi:transcriptional repressor LexA [bacterium]|jgi:repressor LexA|nr:transcriptional repressor LexA [bacterium]MBT4122090.1 transcriptional repressor LexA [bacterium]MBT4335566.1 transcriptional repressor LexA [bacterium]MBT4495573.1 transcriptional repressor LexA [bacterium]MBT4764231.1 transcriptional repressor LexA [bacterium]
MEKLTKRQKEVLDYVNQYIDDNSYAPSYLEIADNLGVSSSATIHQHIKALEGKGYLKSFKNQKRALEPIMLSSYRDAIAIDLPLVGLITAGKPIEAVEGNETMAIPADFVTNSDNSYVLRVKGQSMIDEGIWDGDYVIVERNHSPQNGDVVVALLDNAYATLKKFYKENNRIRLQPANATMKPIYAKDPLIQGIVRAVIRKFATV